MLSSPYVLLAALLTLAGITSAAYIKGRGDGADKVIASQAREDAVRMETLQLAQHAAAEEIAKIEVTNRTIYQKVERETRIEPRYVDCRNTERVMQLINAALAGTGVPADPGELPATN